MTILVSPFTSGLSKQLCLLARMLSLSQLKTIKVSVFGLKLGIIFTYIYIQKTRYSYKCSLYLAKQLDRMHCIFFVDTHGLLGNKGMSQVKKCRIFFLQNFIYFYFFSSNSLFKKKISFFSMDNARPFSQYIIKQDICIYIPYSWPNGWTEWAEIF